MNNVLVRNGTHGIHHSSSLRDLFTSYLETKSISSASMEGIVPPRGTVAANLVTAAIIRSVILTVPLHDHTIVSIGIKTVLLDKNVLFSGLVEMTTTRRHAPCCLLGAGRFVQLRSNDHCRSKLSRQGQKTIQFFQNVVSGHQYSSRIQCFVYSADTFF